MFLNAYSLFLYLAAADWEQSIFQLVPLQLYFE